MSGDLIEAWTLAMTTRPIPTPASELAELREAERQARVEVQRQMHVLAWHARRRAWRHRSGLVIYPGFAALLIAVFMALGPLFTWGVLCLFVMMFGRRINAVLHFPLADPPHYYRLHQAREDHDETFAALTAFEATLDPALVWPELHPVSIEALIEDAP
jgi:hypothetical protein